MSESLDHITLSEFADRIKKLVEQPQTRDVWVTAELQDVSVRGGHCYMELLEKDDSGRQTARIRGCCWAFRYPYVSRKFKSMTGYDFASGLKVLLQVSASMHPVFGLSLVINDISPEFTLGDLLQRRMAMIDRLTKEGVINLNRELKWPIPTQRIAVISARGAAGFGDFVNQLFLNQARLRFDVGLFPAVMQGEKAPQSIIAALNTIAAEKDRWDCVVIIRGGGATSDLLCFEDYDLAHSVATFPLPVAIGIGHERDTTLLDYVSQRFKTPTAVAEWLVGRGESLLTFLANTATKIQQLATEQTAAARQQLSEYRVLLPATANAILDRARSSMTTAATSLRRLSSEKILPARTTLEMFAQSVPVSARKAILLKRERLENAAGMLALLSPAATLARGYSIVRVNGKAVSSVRNLPPGTAVDITLADGAVSATTNK